MSGNFILVVGDNLAIRSQSVDLVPLSRLDSLLDGEFANGSIPLIVPGQGIGECERETLRSALRRRGLPDSLLVDMASPTPLDHSEVHKRNPDNVLIAGLQKISDDRFEASLRISDRQEMLLDHTTGSHIAGMVIMEAMRQMSLAVGERYVLTPSHPPHRFLMDSLQMSFHTFLLPLPSRLEYTLAEVEHRNRNRVRFVGRCDVLQTEVLAASGSMNVQVMDASLAKAIEAQRIRETARAVCELLEVPALAETEERAAHASLNKTTLS